MRRPLTLGEFWVLDRALRYRRAYGCWPSTDYLSAATRLTDAEAQAAMGYLFELGYLPGRETAA